MHYLLHFDVSLVKSLPCIRQSSGMDRDLALALKLQKEYDEEFSRSEKKRSFMNVLDVADSKASIVDPTLEFTDPTPDVHRMFLGFDKRFFWSSLGSVEVMWSSRMTKCAGICRYRRGNGATTIHLSLPLLKLRPRKDLVETLLHEMIHAYLFVTRNYKDRDGHGPEFQSHMYRINKSAGTNITIFHSFHDEVRLYKTHWWRCNGPCQQQKPFFGIVKRSMNRAPGPYDFWFADHQRKCGGEFIKIKEPENFKSRKRNKGSDLEKGKAITSKGNKMPEFFKPSVSKPALPNGGLYTASGGTATETIMSVSKLPKNDTDSSLGQQIKPSPTKPNIVPFSGQGHTLGKNTVPVSDKPWLKRFENTPSTSSVKSKVKDSPSPSKRINYYFPTVSSNSKKSKIDEKIDKEIGKNKDKQNYFDEAAYEVSCPVCNKSIEASKVNNHLDLCIISNNEDMMDDKTIFSKCVVCDHKLGKDNKEPTLCSICEAGACSSDMVFTDPRNEDRSISCPMCEKFMSNSDLERHLEVCIEDATSDKNTTQFDEYDGDIVVEWMKCVSKKNTSDKEVIEL